MSELSREELRAHLSAVEAQVRAALRIVAAESKSVQQAHIALRADLSAALVRLQSDINNGNNSVAGKIDKLNTDVHGLAQQRKVVTAILFTLVVLFGVSVGLLAGGSLFLLQNINSSRAVSIPLTNILDGNDETNGNANTSRSTNIGNNQITLPK